jgi:hypothetical protein
LKTGTYFSAGKLLLSGEYLVLYGAKALALPLKPGQRMVVSEGIEKGLMHWFTNVTGKEWFSADFRIPSMDIIRASDDVTAAFVQQLLLAGCSMNPSFLNKSDSYQVVSDIEFDINWGLGSSSSLVSNLAWWMNIDPYRLFRKIFPGSGYDVFCARAKRPLLFQISDEMPVIMDANFNPGFKDSLWFVYLGKKQDSQRSVVDFKTNARFREDDVKEISGLTQKMINSDNLDDFISLIHRHEEVMSGILKMNTVKDERFPGFHGAVKSLGAWGGDFIMAATLMPETELRAYFIRKGYGLIFRYDELAAGF